MIFIPSGPRATSISNPDFSRRMSMGHFGLSSVDVKLLLLRLDSWNLLNLDWCNGDLSSS